MPAMGLEACAGKDLHACRIEESYLYYLRIRFCFFMAAGDAGVCNEGARILFLLSWCRAPGG